MVLRKFVRNKYLQVSKLIRQGSDVLDIGCNKAEIRHFLPNVSYYGIDINKSQIKELNKKGLKVFYADLNKDELPITKKFDYILMLDILEHLVNPRDLIIKSKQLLKKDGYLIISLPNDYHLLNKIRFLFNQELFQSFVPSGHLHIFPIKNGKFFLENNNLRIIKKINLPSPKPSFVPQFIKKFLCEVSPNNFARGVLYLTKSI